MNTHATAPLAPAPHADHAPAPFSDPRNADAYANGRGHLDSIVAAYEAAQFCQEEYEGWQIGREAKQLLREHGYPADDRATVLERIEESQREAPLCCEVRSGWTLLNGDGPDFEPEEWRILLSTGGPELVLQGHFNRYREPAGAELRYRTWGTQFEPVRTTSDEQWALCWFAALFYWGE